MLEEIRNIKSKKGDLRNFGITIGIILITIAVLLLWKEKQSYKTFIAVGTLLCLSGFILPIILKPFFIAWMTFAIILGWFMTRLILALVFSTFVIGIESQLELVLYWALIILGIQIPTSWWISCFYNF